MKKILFGFLFLGVLTIGIYAAATTHKGPIQSGTRAQGDTADVATDDGDIYAYGDIEADGDLDVAGETTIADDVSITGDQTFDGVSNYSMSGIIALDTGASTSLTVTDRYMLVVGSTNTADSSDTGAYSNILSSATPFISTMTATNGDTVIVMGTTDSGYVQLKDNAELDGTLLELDGSSVTLTGYSNIKLVYYSG